MLLKKLLFGHNSLKEAKKMKTRVLASRAIHRATIVLSELKKLLRKKMILKDTDVIFQKISLICFIFLDKGDKQKDRVDF